MRFIPILISIYFKFYHDNRCNGMCRNSEWFDDNTMKFHAIKAEQKLDITDEMGTNLYIGH